MSDRTSEPNELNQSTAKPYHPPMPFTFNTPISPAKRSFENPFVTDNETISNLSSNPVGLLPHPLLNSCPNPLMWLNQSTRLFDMNPEFFSNTVCTEIQSNSTLIPSTETSHPRTCLGIDGIQYSEVGNNASNASMSSTRSESGIELQGDGSFSGCIFPLSDLMLDNKEEPEELKWSDYLNGAFPVSSVFQSRTQTLYGF